MPRSRFYTEAPYVVRKTVAFDGTAGNGAQGTVSLFTVTGEVLVAILVPYCTESLVGASATIALGVTNAPALFVAATVAENLDADEFWVDTDPDAYGVLVPAELKDVAIGEDVIATIATADVTDGTIEFALWWMPLSADANIEAA